MAMRVLVDEYRIDIAPDFYRFPVPRTYLYDIREDAAESRCYLIRSLDDSYNECKDKQTYPDLQAKCKNYAEILRKRMHTELVPVVSIHQNQQAGGKEHDLTLASLPLS